LFAAALEGTLDSVMVWSPGEDADPPGLKLNRVTAVIRRCYRPEARFGGIEVWRRSPEAPTSNPALRRRYDGREASPATMRT
jgi:hypothetical protein